MSSKAETEEISRTKSEGWIAIGNREQLVKHRLPKLTQEMG